MEDVENIREPLDRSKEDVIKAFFDYDAETGDITWKEWVSPTWYKRDSNHRNFLRERAGKPVNFCISNNGYLLVTAVRVHNIYSHHIAWVLTYGNMPEHHIDHIDGNPENNRIGNLRDVPQVINLRNQRMARNNTSGVTGISFHKRRNKWRVKISFDGKDNHLGYYRTIEEAAKVRSKFLTENMNLGFTERHGKPNVITNDEQKENQ